MDFSSSVPQIEFSATGITLPTDAEILAGVQADIDAAFGGGLNPALETPQGQLASSEASIISQKNSEIAYIVNQIDPQYADGRFQDAIGRIYFLTRKAATSTTVECTCVGLSGTVIPSGTLAQDTQGYTYASTADATIPAGGSVTVTFANQTKGPIACLAGTLNQVYQAISGWDSITNPTDGTLGRDEETRAEFETRRQASVAINASGTTQSIYAAVMASGEDVGLAPGDAFVIENNEDVAVVSATYGITLAPHSVYIAVSGGSEAYISEAIWSKLSGGCGFTPTCLFTASISGTIMNVTAVSSGFLAVGQTVMGSGLGYDVAISSFGSGTGSTGTYNLSSNMGTIASESMSSATVYAVEDANYGDPRPTYYMMWTTPKQLAINFAVIIAKSSVVPANIQSLVEAAISNAMNGLDGGDKARIGGTVYASRFYDGIQSIAVGLQIKSLLLGTGSPTATYQDVPVYSIPIIGTITVTVS